VTRQRLHFAIRPESEPLRRAPGPSQKTRRCQPHRPTHTHGRDGVPTERTHRPQGTVAVPTPVGTGTSTAKTAPRDDEPAPPLVNGGHPDWVMRSAPSSQTIQQNV